MPKRETFNEQTRIPSPPWLHGTTAPRARSKAWCTDRFDDPNLPGAAPIPVEACYLGWQQSLNHLANLVESDIKD
jgi:hypothetical protein